MFAAAVLVATPMTAAACDPEWDWCGYSWDDLWYDPYWYEPSWYDPPVYETPTAPAPSWSDPFVWSSPGYDVIEAVVAPVPVAVPDPDARLAELGLHRVTDVYTGSSVTTEGLVTTYASSTTPLDAGTGAKLVASVATGQTSPYDSVVFNGRAENTGGALVSGDVYENRIWNGDDWVVDRYVFFQDDVEIATVASPSAPPIPPAIVAPPPAAASAEPPMFVPIVAPLVSGPTLPAFVAPWIEDLTDAPVAPQASGPVGSQPAQWRDVRVGIALASQADPLGRIEVLRGRRIALWVRATVDGTPARVLAWTLVFGDLTALGPVSGTGDDPLLATWRSVSTIAYPVRVLATVDVPGEGSRQLEAAIEVIVRSPALVE
jgi:hypothetical protein